MERLTSLKRQAHEINYTKCIICQTDKSDKLRAGSVQGYDRIMQCAHERHKKKDIDNRDSRDRIISSVHGNVCWHSNCYSSFTSKTHIDRLKKIHTEPCTSQNTSIETQKLRRTEKHIHWDKCMFCQERCNDQLHSVQSFNTSKKIIDATRYDHKLSVAFAGICDLIASEGKYHLKCYANFLRDTTEVRDCHEK